MLEQTPRREAGTKRAGSAFESVFANKDRRRMFFALVLLLLSLAVVLVKNREIWFAADETSAADESPAWNPNTPMPVAPVPAATQQKLVATPIPVSAKPANSKPMIAASHAALPPLEIVVVGGDTRSNSVKVTMPPQSVSEAAASTSVEWGPATAERVQMASDKAPEVPRSVELPY